MTSAEEREILRHAPTADTWLAQLRRLLAGEFEQPAMEHLGSAEGFIKTTLANSRAPGDALVALHAALEALVLQCELHPVSRPAESIRIFELLVAFKPRGGLVPVVNMLSRIGEATITVGSGNSAVDLHAYALAVLKTYFPLAASHIREYDVYVRILREHLAYRAYAGHALVCLLELGALHMEDNAVGVVCAADGDALREVLRYYLHPRYSMYAGDVLAKLYVHMRKADLQAFVDAVASLGGQVKDVLNSPTIHYQGRRIALSLTDRDRGVLVMDQIEDFDKIVGRTAREGSA